MVPRNPQKKPNLHQYKMNGGRRPTRDKGRKQTQQLVMGAYLFYYSRSSRSCFPVIATGPGPHCTDPSLWRDAGCDERHPPLVAPRSGVGRCASLLPRIRIRLRFWLWLWLWRRLLHMRRRCLACPNRPAHMVLFAELPGRLRSAFCLLDW